MIDRLKEQKETGVSLNITFIMALIIFVIQITPLIQSFQGLSYNYVLNFNYVALKTIILLVPSILFEKRKKSFTAHLSLLAFFLNPYILKVFNMGGFNNFIEYLIFILGLLMAIYSSIKLYAHKDELNQINQPNRNIDIVIFITSIKVFLDQGFNEMAVYILLFITVILSLRRTDALILSLSVYASSLVSNLYILFQNVNSPSNIYSYIIFSIIVNILMIVFILRIYRENDSYNNYYTN